MASKGRQLRARGSSSDSDDDRPRIRPGAAKSSATAPSAGSKMLPKKLAAPVAHLADDEMDGGGGSSLRLKSSILLPSDVADKNAGARRLARSDAAMDRDRLASSAQQSQQASVKPPSEYSVEGLARLKAQQRYVLQASAPSAPSDASSSIIAGMEDVDMEGSDAASSAASSSSVRRLAVGSTTAAANGAGGGGEDMDDAVDMMSIQVEQAKRAREAARRRNAFGVAATADGGVDGDVVVGGADGRGGRAAAASAEDGFLPLASSAVGGAGRASHQAFVRGGVENLGAGPNALGGAASASDAAATRQWEQDVIRRGAGSALPSSTATAGTAPQQQPLPSPTSGGAAALPDPNLLLSHLQHGLLTTAAQLREAGSRAGLDLTRAETDLRDQTSSLKVLSSQLQSASSSFDFYQSLRLYCADLVACMREKAPLIADLEGAQLALESAASLLLQWQRAVILTDDATEAITKQGCVLIEGAQEMASAVAAAKEALAAAADTAGGAGAGGHGLVQSVLQLVTSSTREARQSSAATATAQERQQQQRQMQLVSNAAAALGNGTAVGVLDGVSSPPANSASSAAGMVDLRVFDATFPTAASASTSAQPPDAPGAASLILRQRASLDTARSLLLADVHEQYATVSGVLHRFNGWKGNGAFARAYVDSYAFLALPDLLGPLVRLQLAAWTPMPLSSIAAGSTPSAVGAPAQGGGGDAIAMVDSAAVADAQPSSSLDSLEFFSALWSYGEAQLATGATGSASAASGGLPSSSPTAAADDESRRSDEHLLPRLVTSHALPRLAMLLQHRYDPLSLASTRAAVAAVQDVLAFEPEQAAVGALAKGVAGCLTRAVSSLVVPVMTDADGGLSLVTVRQFLLAVVLLKSITSWECLLSSAVMERLACEGVIGAVLVPMLTWAKDQVATRGIGAGSTVDVHQRALHQLGSVCALVLSCLPTDWKEPTSDAYARLVGEARSTEATAPAQLAPLALACRVATTAAAATADGHGSASPAWLLALTSFVPA